MSSNDGHRILEIMRELEGLSSTETSPLMRRDLSSGLDEILTSLAEFMAFAKHNELPFLAHMIEMTALQVVQHIADQATFKH